MFVVFVCIVFVVCCCCFLFCWVVVVIVVGFLEGLFLFCWFWVIYFCLCIGLWEEGVVVIIVIVRSGQSV